jgi:hypothetical protein
MVCKSLDSWPFRQDCPEHPSRRSAGGFLRPSRVLLAGRGHQATSGRDETGDRVSCQGDGHELERARGRQSGPAPGTIPSAHFVVWVWAAGIAFALGFGRARRDIARAALGRMLGAMIGTAPSEVERQVKKGGSASEFRMGPLLRTSNRLMTKRSARADPIIPTLLDVTQH